MRLTLRGIRLALPLTVAVVLGLACTAKAQVTNPTFGTGDYTGWTTSGNASIETYATLGESPSNPPNTFQALLQTTNASTGGGTGNTPTLVSGQGAQAYTGSLDAFLGLSDGTLKAGTFYNGTAIKQTFSAVAGESLTFDANFLTNELTNGDGNPDQAYAYLFNGSTLVAGLPLDIGHPTQATNPTGSADTLFTNKTYYQTFALNGSYFTSTGSYTLAFAVLNGANNGLIDSGLAIDNIQTFGPTTVPLPAGVWAGLLGLALSLGIVFQMRRRMHVAA